MKKKLFLMVGLLIAYLIPINIFAANLPDSIHNVIIEQSGSYTTDYAFNEHENGNHRQSVFGTNLTIDGACYATQGAYCVTPGATNHPAGGYKCTLVSTSNGNVSEYTIASSIIMNRSDIDYMLKAVALRMLTAVKDQTACNGHAKCLYIMNGYKEYYNYKTGVSSANPSTYFKDGFESSTTLNAAVEVVKSALNGASTSTSASGYSYVCKPENTGTYAQQFIVKLVPVSCGSCDDTPTEEVGDLFDGDVNNCCEDNTRSTIREGVLDDLFTDYSCLGVVKYQLKKNVGGYKVNEPQFDDKYCELYCSERIEIAQPGAFNVALNHQFELNSVEYKGNTYKSPVVDNYRRCRVRIKFHTWAIDYAAAISDANTAYNDYLKAKREKEYYEYAVNHKSVYEGDGNGNKIAISATCTRGTLVGCPSIHSTTNRTGNGISCTQEYNDCDTSNGWVDIGNNKCKKQVTRIGSNCTTGYSYNSTSGKCEKIETKSSAGYTCTENTAPTPAITDDTKTVTKYFNGRIYNFGSTTYSYSQYTVRNDSGVYTVPGTSDSTPLYKKFTIVSAPNGSGNHSLYSAYSTEGNLSVTQRITNLTNDMNDMSSKMAGSKACVLNTNASTYYNVTCSTNLGVLETAKDSAGNINDENVEAKYNEYVKDNGTIDQKVSAYVSAINAMKTLTDKLYVCNNYYSEYNGSNPENYGNLVDPKLEFTYDQFYIDEFGKIVSQRLPVKFNRVCENKPVQVPDLSVYNNPGSLQQIPAEENIDNIISSRYSDAYGNTAAVNNLYRCATNASGVCDATATKTILATGSLSSVLETVSVKPAFEYDALYNTLCYWEPEEQVFVAAGHGTTTNKEKFDFDNSGRKFVYIFSDNTLSGVFQTYSNLSNLGTGTASRANIANLLKQQKTCAKQDVGAATNADKWATFTCKYTAYDFESKTGYCDDNNTGVPVVDPANCKKDQKIYYSFKVIDENNIFPTCGDTSTKSGMEACYTSMAYGYNWLKTEEGQDILNAIQSANTYDTVNLTYSFKLDSQAMKAIKDYNKTRIAKGGYEDFNLRCYNNCNVSLDSISPEHKTIDLNGKVIDVVYYDTSCTKCFSNFLDDLTKNQIGSQTLTGGKIWNRNVTLADVRNNFSW